MRSSSDWVLASRQCRRQPSANAARPNGSLPSYPTCRPPGARRWCGRRAGDFEPPHSWKPPWGLVGECCSTIRWTPCFGPRPPSGARSRSSSMRVPAHRSRPSCACELKRSEQPRNTSTVPLRGWWSSLRSAARRKGSFSLRRIWRAKSPSSRRSSSGEQAVGGGPSRPFGAHSRFSTRWHKRIGLGWRSLTASWKRWLAGPAKLLSAPRSSRR